MSKKVRNIPDTSHDEIHTQTDLNLIQRDKSPSSQQIQDPLALAYIKTSSQALDSLRKPEETLRKQLNQLLEELRKGAPYNKDWEKRISVIENQLTGLLRQRIFLEGKDGGKNTLQQFYELLQQKDNQILRLQMRLALRQRQGKKADQKIQILQKEIKALQKTIDLQKRSIEENKVHELFIDELRQKKVLAQSQLKSLEKKLSAIEKKNSEYHQEKQINELARYFGTQLVELSEKQAINTQTLNDHLVSLFQSANISVTSELDSLQLNLSYQDQYQRLKEKTKTAFQTLRKQYESLCQKYTSLEKQKGLKSLLTLFEEGYDKLELMEYRGWIGIGSIGRNHYQFTCEESAKLDNHESTSRLTSSLVKTLKNLLGKYPKLGAQLDNQTRFLIQKAGELFSSQEDFERIKTIVAYENTPIRVENVYSYDNTKERETIFRLRVLLKSLLEEMGRIRNLLDQFTEDDALCLDEGLLQMIRKEALESVDVESILKLYRPPPRVMEVEKIVERPVYINSTLEKGVPVRTDRPVLVERQEEKMVEVTKEIPIYVERPVENLVREYVEVEVAREKVVEVPSIREVVVEKLMVNQMLKEVEVERLVPLYEEKLVEVPLTKEIVVEVNKMVQVEKPIPVPGPTEYKEVEKQVEKPVYLKQLTQRVKEVEVIQEKVFEKDRYLQIERAVPYVVTHRETVYLDREVPRFITNTQEKDVQLRQVIEKPVPYKVTEEKVVEVPVIQEKELIREVQREIIVDCTHFIKGDREEILKEVEIIVQKPLREEVLLTKEVEVQRAVPLYIREEKPVYIELQVPYVQHEVRVVQAQVTKVVPIREEVVKEVRVEVPVPVVVEKEVIRTQTVFVDRIVEKIVEVPRVVEVEKIVQKIVPIPRIIEKIVEVPRIVEKIVTVEVPSLQIVQVIREVPVVTEVEIVREVFIEKPIVQVVKEVEIAQKNKTVELTVEREVLKQVEVERRIPTEVVKQVPIEVFRDRVVEKLVEIHEVTVKDREVVVPLRHEVPIELIVEKPVVTQKVIQQLVKVPQVVEREVPVTQTVTIPEIVEVIVEKPVEVEVIKEVPGAETIRYIDVPKEVEVLREKVVTVEHLIQVPKEVYLYMDKIVHEHHQQMHPIHVPKVVEQPLLVEISKPQHFVHYKEVPVEVKTNHNVPVRTVVDQIKEVFREIHHSQDVETVREKLKEVVKETQNFIHKEVEKELLREVIINQTHLQPIQVPGETKIIETNSTQIVPQHDTSYVEKIVEKIIMLPQVLEVAKHFHQIQEVRDPGITSGSTLQQHQKQFSSVSQELRTALQNLLERFRQNIHRQPDLKNLVPLIETNLRKVEEWIKFPKILEVPREVEKTVQKQKVVLIPSRDHQKEASLSYLVEKLVTELRRIKERHRIDLQLEEDIQRLFFESKGTLNQSQLAVFQQKLKSKYKSLGSWAESYPFMINSFLQDYFNLNSIIQEIQKDNKMLRQKNDALESQLRSNLEEIIALSASKAEILRNYSELIENIRKNHNGLTAEEVIVLTKEYGLSTEQESSLRDNKGEIGKQPGDKYLSQGDRVKQLRNWMQKVASLQEANQELNRKTANYENRIRQLEVELQELREMQSRYPRVTSQKERVEKVLDQLKKVKSQHEVFLQKIRQEHEVQIQNLQQAHKQQIEKRSIEQQKMKNDQIREIERLKAQKISASNNELAIENRKLAEELRGIRRDMESEKRSIQSIKKQHQRQVQNLKKQHELAIERKDKNIASIQNVKSRIAEDYERQIAQLREVHEREFSRFKATQQIKSQEKQTNQELAVLKEKEVTQLRDKIKRLEIELQTSKKQIQNFQQQRSKMGQTAYTASIFTSAGKQLQEGSSHLSPEQVKHSKIEGTYSAVERKYVKSPASSIKSQQDDQFSKKSVSSRRSDLSSKYKPQMTLREFMEFEDGADKGSCITFVMIKIIQKIEEEAEQGLLHSFSPSNIYLHNLNPKNLQALSIKFGAPIVNRNKKDGLYLAPQILSGQKTSAKSVVFTLGVIWDELIHGQTYFRSIEEIQSSQHEFKVRDTKLNPILKNTLFEMMNKEPSKRLQLRETKRRLSLQKYIASESKR